MFFEVFVKPHNGHATRQKGSALQALHF